MCSIHEQDIGWSFLVNFRFKTFFIGRDDLWLFFYLYIRPFYYMFLERELLWGIIGIIFGGHLFEFPYLYHTILEPVFVHLAVTTTLQMASSDLCSLARCSSITALPLRSKLIFFAFFWILYPRANLFNFCR